MKLCSYEKCLISISQHNVNFIRTGLLLNAGRELCSIIYSVRTAAACSRTYEFSGSTAYIIYNTQTKFAVAQIQTFSLQSFFLLLNSLYVTKIPMANGMQRSSEPCSGKAGRAGTYGYMAIVVNLTKISLLGASAVLQVKA